MFKDDLLEFLSEERNEMKKKYNRVLPTGELLFNRFDKGEYLNMGKNSSAYDTSIIMGDVEFGDNVWVGPYTLIEGIHGKVKIGNYVSINSGVYIFTHDSTKYYLSGGKNSFEHGAVSVGDFSVIGNSSMIYKNVKVGSRCLVLPNSQVNNDIEDNSIVSGAPARKIGKVILLEDGNVEYSFFK